ncbi:serine/arginine repetitive matrix protein 1 [Phoenix dactylifera]|uniref:Serine/arginine repetitive matrix protein 1 n=1 Tax=Phoenix dactylifera TaxID=42345 RepID=A0A8B9A804_PHODC|nr:serine/arginine repetitive matrix protein 1 [Phoenix dactylifera]
MSGGFFRGTSADQDARFSNKQAKLLKSQKFAPELDHVVDMTKVQMDVIRPWIATRVTELLGFEDEVLINFVYGLLDGKEVDGKQMQIQLTGFMEKNTGKFMKELWGLLLSAQNNASGVPQQFLDAKKEETDKRKAETDRIAQEIQQRKEKEGRELEQEKQRRMDGAADKSRSSTAVLGSVSKRSPRMAFSVHPEDDREVDTGHDSRSKSQEGRKSRSVSGSSQSQRYSISPKRRHRSPSKRSISSERRYRSPPRRSISPRRRHSPRYARSPLRQRSPHTRRRSVSLSRHRSPSPVRRRSPYARRRSPSYAWRRSPPLRRRSPVQVRRRSPSPSRYRSPIRRKSLSPARRRSPSPLRRRSPPPRSPKHRRRSPLCSPRSRVRDYETSPRQRKRRRSPYRSRSPSYPSQSSSKEIDNRIEGIDSKYYRDGYTSQRSREKKLPVHHTVDRAATERPVSGRKVSESRRLPISSRSPKRDSRNQNDIHDREHGVTSEESPNQSESPSRLRRIAPRGIRSCSPSESPVKQTRRQMPRRDSPETNREREQPSYGREDAYHRSDSSCKKRRDSPANVQQKDSHAKDFSPQEYSSGRLADDYSPAAQGQARNLEIRKKEHEENSEEDLPERHKRLVLQSPEQIEYGPGRIVDESYPPDNFYDRQRLAKKHVRDASSEERVSNEHTVKSIYGDGYAVKAAKQSRSKSDEYRESRYETESDKKFKKKVDQSNQFDTHDSDSEEIGAHRYQEMEKRRRKRSDKHKRDLDDSSESDFQIDDKKEAKRRRKDEKRLRKEERRRRREERHRRKLERRAGKHKVKSVDTVTPPSDLEKIYNDADGSNDDGAIGKHPHLGDIEETESEQKKLEIELREKALESLRAKKAISH